MKIISPKWHSNHRHFAYEEEALAIAALIWFDDIYLKVN